MMRMRWFMRSRASIGMAIVNTVAKAQIAARIVTMKVGLVNVSMRSIAGHCHFLIERAGAPSQRAQNLKLIIFRMTRTPISIQNPHTKRAKLPVRVSNRAAM